MSAADFSYTPEQLRDLAQQALKHAAGKGATACEVDVSEAYGQSVTVRRQDVDTIEYNRDKGMGVTVYMGQRRGHASTSDFSSAAVASAVEAALSIATFTAEDSAAGLPDEKLLAKKHKDFDLFHPWDLPVEEAIELAKRCEAAAFAVSPRITNSEGGSISTQQSQFVSANSLGFMGGFATSRHSLSCSVIAGEGDDMQRDDWYSSKRIAADLLSPEQIGKTAAKRAVARLGARSLKTRKVPVIFEAPLAAGLVGAFVHAVSGGAMYRKSSFLLDSMGKKVFPEFIQLDERPHIKRGMASTSFDDEGVATKNRDVVVDGRVEGYFLSSYTARKLGMQTTANAGGSHNLIFKSSDEARQLTLKAMLKEMGTGLLVTELLGQGVNYVTGDYSRGAAGFWVENGVIAYPVHEITIAGNMKQMFKGIVAVGKDSEYRGSKKTGSIWIDKMTVAGA
jgi:PmbA protein